MTTADRDNQVVGFLTQFIVDHNHPPTTREIGDGLGMSVATVHRCLTRLKESGRITVEGVHGQRALTVRVQGETP